MTDLDRLDALAGAATPGPWAPFADTKAPLYGRVGCVAVEETREPICGGTNGTDATFIAACDPATIRELLAAVRERDELREAAEAGLAAIEYEIGLHPYEADVPAHVLNTRNALRAALHREAGA